MRGSAQWLSFNETAFVAKFSVFVLPIAARTVVKPHSRECGIEGNGNATPRHVNRGISFDGTLARLSRCLC
jgi:hypothetical protein